MKRGGRRSAGSGASSSPRQAGDITQPPASLEQLADKAYDSDALRATIAATAVIPSQQDHHSPRCHSLGTAIALSTALIVSSTSGDFTTRSAVHFTCLTHRAAAIIWLR